VLIAVVPAKGLGRNFLLDLARNFGERLKPVLQKYKIESREPRPQPVKNTIKGKSL